MTIEINIYSSNEIIEIAKMSFKFFRVLELQDLLTSIKDFNKNLNKRKINFCNGMCYNYKYPVMLGNCSNINRVIKTLTHEINHLIIDKTMKESGLNVRDCDFYEMERINRIMNQESEYVFNKLIPIMDYLGW